MASTLEQPSIGQLESTLGVLFVGYVVSMIAYGFTFFQTYVYYTRYPTDHWAIKTTVATVCILDTATSALISHALYFYLVFLFPYATGLENATTTLCAENTLSVLVVYVVQIYYAYRIWMLSKNAVLSSIIGMLSTAAFGLGIAMSTNMFKNTSLASLAVTQTMSIVSTAQAFTTISAFITFGALCFYLNPASHLEIKPLEGWYDIVVAYTISRGSAATIIQFGYLITFATMPSKVIWMPFQLVASKLFVNSLLTMLNSRDIYHGRGINEEDFISVGKSNGTSYSGNSRSTNIEFEVMHSKPTISIGVTQTVEESSEKIQNWDSQDPLENGTQKSSRLST